MSPEVKAEILKSYECRLKASGREDKKAAYRRIVEEIKSIPTTDLVDQIKEGFSDIKRALHANPQCSQEELFNSCSTAFELAEVNLKNVNNFYPDKI